jgi:hypothetical protein
MATGGKVKIGRRCVQPIFRANVPRCFVFRQNCFLLLVGSLFVAGWAAAQDRRPPKQPRNPAQLVKLLGSNSYHEREEAMRRLMDMDEAVAPLEAARSSPDAEIRARAHLILSTLRQRTQTRAAGELLHKIEPGHIEEIIAHLSTKNGGDSDEHWQALFQLVAQVTSRASRIRGAEFRVLANDPAKLELVRTCTLEGCWQKRVLLAGLNQAGASLGHCLLVSAGPVKHLRRVSCSVLVINGDLAGCTNLRTSVILCRGNVGPLTTVDDSIVLATGRIEKVMCAEDSLFQARDLGRFTSSGKNVFLNHKDVAAVFSGEDRFLQARPQAPGATPIAPK